MGARGPAPKPTNLKALEGNPGKRPLNQDEPQPEPGAKCPPWLCLRGQSEWHRLAPILERCGVLTAADSNALGAYCDAVANYIRTTLEIERLDSLVEQGPHGTKAVPLVNIQKTYADLMAKYGAKLGLSPADRVGIKVVPKSKGSRWGDKITA